MGFALVRWLYVGLWCRVLEDALRKQIIVPLVNHFCPVLAVHKLARNFFSCFPAQLIVVQLLTDELKRSNIFTFFQTLLWDAKLCYNRMLMKQPRQSSLLARITIIAKLSLRWTFNIPSVPSWLCWIFCWNSDLYF